MSLHDLQPFLGPLSALFGIIGALVGGAVWFARRMITKLERENTRLKRKNAELQEKLDRNQKDVESLATVRRERDEAVKVAAELKGQSQVAAARVAELTRQNDELLKQGRRVREERDAARKERDDGLAKLATAEQSLANATADLSNVRTQLRQAVAKQEASQQSASDLSLELTTTAGQLQQVRTERDTVVQERDKLLPQAQQLKELKKQIKNLRNQGGQVWLSAVPPDVPKFLPLKERRATIIAVMNLKGGVGKTTITANIAGLFGRLGKKVLMLDLDHQRSLSQMLLCGQERLTRMRQRKSFQDYLTADTHDGPQLLSNACQIGGMEGCELIPNHDPIEHDGPGLDDLEMHLLMEWLLCRGEVPDVRYILRGGLHTPAVHSAFDHVFLDCPPRLTTACVNALAAADFVLIPIQPEPVASLSVLHLLRRLHALREAGIAPHLKVIGLLGNMAPARNDMSSSPEVQLLEQIADNTGQYWDEPVSRFDEVLIRYGQYADAARYLEQEGQLRLAIHYKPVYEQFECLAHEIEERIDEHRQAE